jgi:hypothetical protein
MRSPISGGWVLRAHHHVVVIVVWCLLVQVRYNRKRLKGSKGNEDCLYALASLYDVLLSVCKVGVLLQQQHASWSYDNRWANFILMHVGQSGACAGQCDSFLPKCLLQHGYSNTSLD